ncbi:MAG TPA: hypothetical protein VKI45_04095 [Allosphingosinicella sp.]|nr:hypothetical protein [Allosphingosinicella sp.]
MERIIVLALLVLPAAAPPPAARPSIQQVRIHRGAQPQHGRWHHWPANGDRGGERGWGSYGYAAGYAGDTPPRPSGAGFFEDGDSWMQGHRVVYDYDRGYPYDHYRAPRPRLGPAR